MGFNGYVAYTGYCEDTRAIYLEGGTPRCGEEEGCGRAV